MDWIVAIVIGGIIGWLASLVMKTDMQMGLIGNVVVGILGSSLGFWLAGTFGLAATNPWVAWVVAVGGAAILIFLLKVLGIIKPAA